MDEQNVAVQSNDQETEYTAKEIKKDLLRLYASPTYQKLNAYYGRENFFNILGKSRDENAHSNFLAWLLDSRASHGLGTYPMEMFLRMLNFAKTVKCNEYACVPDDFDTITFTSTLQIQNVKVSREARATKATSGKQRMDFCIEVTYEAERNPIYVVIENKVKSSEHDDQTTAYRNHIKAKYPDCDAIFVYLTPLPSTKLERLEKQECQCKDYIQINYQYLLDYVIQPCMSMELPKDAKFFLENYIRCLGDSSYYEGGSDLVMAIGAEERELLQKFWNENENLIEAYVSMISEDLDEKTKALLNKEMNKRKPKYNYSFEGKVYSSMPRLAYAVLQTYVSTNPDVTYDDMKKVFPDEFGSPGYGLVFEKIGQGKAKNDYPDRFVKDKIHLEKEGIDIVVSNQWDSSKNFQSFLNGIKKTIGYEVAVIDAMK